MTTAGAIGLFENSPDGPPELIALIDSAAPSSPPSAPDSNSRLFALRVLGATGSPVPDHGFRRSRPTVANAPIITAPAIASRASPQFAGLSLQPATAPATAPMDPSRSRPSRADSATVFTLAARTSRRSSPLTIIENPLDRHLEEPRDAEGQ